VKTSTRWLSPCEGPLPKRWPNYCSSWLPDITQLPDGSRHEPHVLLIEPMVHESDAAYCVHRLLAAHDRAALIAAIGSSVRATFQIGGFSIRSQSGVAARATVTRVPAADTGPARKTVKLIMPIWDLPGILRGDQPRPDLPVCKLEAYNFIPSPLREMLGLSDGAPDSLVQIASGEINNIALTSEDRLLRCGRKIWINMAKAHSVWISGLLGFADTSTPREIPKRVCGEGIERRPCNLNTILAIWVNPLMPSW